MGGLVVGMASAVAQFTRRPFNNFALDLLDMAATLCTTFYIGCGLAFLDSRLDEDHHIVYQILGYLLLMTAALTLIFAFLICAIVCLPTYTCASTRSIYATIFAGCLLFEK